jgi:GNAT superfamily N-acetyltransferase
VSYRHVRVEHEATAERMASSARAEGWRVDREVVMVLEGPAGPPAGGGPVREGTLEEVLELTDAWYVEEGEATSDEVGANLREMTRREHAATPERRFIVEDPPGRPAGMTSIRERDRVCMLEDVYVLPDVRGRGHGRALVRHATDFARRDDHEVVFILADEEGWPKRLYASVGFTPLAARPSCTATAERAAPSVEQPAPAGVVLGLAQVARERGVGRDPRVPRPRVVGGDARGDVHHPRRAAVVEVDELVGGEAPAQAPAQVGDDALDDALVVRRSSAGASRRRRSPSRHW